MLRLSLESKRHLLLGAIVVATGSATWAGDEVTIDIQDLPPAVKAAADGAVPGASWTVAQREFHKDQAKYEIEGRTQAGRPVEVEVEADGTGRNSQTLKVEFPTGQPAAVPPPPQPAERTERVADRSYLWPLSLGVLAVVGLVLKSILDGVFEGIGSAIAKGLGAERVGKVIETRLAQRRATSPTPSDRI